MQLNLEPFLVCKLLTRTPTDCFYLQRTSLSFAGTHLPLELDVTSNESIKGVIEEAINKYKRPPSIVVNCAGITRDAFILKMDDNDFDLVLNVNFKVRRAVAKQTLTELIHNHLLL